jgi:hypothetical protein
VAITPPHLLASVPDDVVNNPLVDPGLGQGRDKRVTKNVEPSNHCPFRPCQRPLEMVVAFLRGQWAGLGTLEL